MKKPSPRLERGDQFFSNGLSLYVNRVYERFDLPEHEHDFVEISYVWEGSGFHYIEDQTIRVSKGDLFFIPIGVSHIFRPSAHHSKDPLIIGNCIFDEKTFRFLTSILPVEYGLYFFQHIHAETNRWIQMREISGEYGRLFESMLIEFQRKRRGYETMLCGLLLQLLIEMERALNREQAIVHPSADKIEQIHQYIRDHLHEKLTIAAIAEHIGLGKRQLQRIVSSYTGQSLTALIQKERIEQSGKLLSDPRLASLTVADIASRVGIHDMKRFHQLFKLAMGATPARYRLEKAAQMAKIMTEAE
ncbi:AraC family L-rhamnose operon transcriptional activator RhaR [Paenibacillus castaneae]|uniref:helix-turn-helix domain-containing protein n=1 Tax=Paenibacillus castaneae TaxID=474957 RepID=UPI000C9D00F0|nr:AraC family transcriptional regulator [Paenibacillus castaneae]NIK79163.1 AraC family L-rhamnose operon transcriptional activator RhaR [Paenibacillus castaneae]